MESGHDASARPKRAREQIGRPTEEGKRDGGALVRSKRLGGPDSKHREKKHLGRRLAQGRGGRGGGLRLSHTEWRCCSKVTTTI